MGKLLFSPSGRIGPGAYLKGSIIVGVIGALLALTGYINIMIFAFAVMLAFLLIVPFIMLSIKRVHDSGKSGWMSLLCVLIAVIVYFATSMLMSIIGLAPSAADQVESKERLEDLQSSGDIAEMMNVMGEVMGPLILPTALIMFLTPVIAAVLVNLFIKSNNHENQFGPATTGDS